MKSRLAKLLIPLVGLMPKRHPIGSVQNQKSFFILGSGRNGSTLLNLILNRHPHLILPTEQYFLATIILKFQLYNHWPWESIVEKVLDTLKDCASHTWELDLMEIERTLLGLSRSEQNLISLLDCLFRSQKTSPEATIWGDSSFTNTIHIPTIYDIYPQAKYIFLIRDGRDVAASFQKGGKEAFLEWADPIYCAKHWNSCIQQFDYLQERQANLLMVKYEELVNEPAAIVERICQHIGAPFYPSMLESGDRVPARQFYSPDHHQNLKNAIDTTSIGRWKSHFSAQEREKLTHLMEDNLKRFGYS